MGIPKLYIKTAASGNKRVQAFCGECGTHLYTAEPEAPNVMNIRLGSVNERAQLAPKVRIWGQSAIPWIKTLQSVTHHAAGMASILI